MKPWKNVLTRIFTILIAILSTIRKISSFAKMLSHPWRQTTKHCAYIMRELLLLKHELFFAECQQGPKHFWNCRVYLGYGPAPRRTKKRPWATLFWSLGWTTNTNWATGLSPEERNPLPLPVAWGLCPHYQTKLPNVGSAS